MVWPSRDEVQAHAERVRELARETPLQSLANGVLTVVVFACVSLAIVACCSPTAPAKRNIFPYAGCTMIQAGEDRLPDGRLDNVWQQWRCTDGQHWQVNANGTVFGMTP